MTQRPVPAAQRPVPAAQRPSHRVEVQRAGDWWSIRVTDVRGLHAQARRLDSVPAMARSAIVMATGAAPDSFEVTVGVDLDERLADLVERATRTRTEADAAARAASEASRAAVAALTAAGLGVRDVGAVLGISHQRVAQLRAGRTGGPPR